MALMFTIEEIKAMVNNGAVWMDKHYPEWPEFINLNYLKMDSCESCIIGQAVGAMSYYDVVENNENGNVYWAEEHGFQAPDHYDDDEKYDWNATAEYYRVLEDGWTDEVRKRRSY